MTESAGLIVRDALLEVIRLGGDLGELLVDRIDLVQDVSLLRSSLLERCSRIRCVLGEGRSQNQQQCSKNTHSVHLGEEAVHSQERGAHAEDGAGDEQGRDVQAR